jgi:hypothetical protein
MKTTITSSLLLFSLLSTTALLSGCGSSSSDDNTTPVSSSVSGQLVDSYIENVDFLCGDGTKGVTDINGTFNCDTLPVSFKLSGLKLGEINTLNGDKQVFPQDLLGVPRTDTNNSDVVAMARFLQSCDDDNDRKNGIKIREQVKESLQTQTDFNADDIDAYASDADVELIDADEAISHLDETTHMVESIDKVDKLPENVRDALLTPANTLTQDVKDTLAYMGNEERLAHDVYISLYNTHLANGTEIKQLTNIATNSETTHIQTVQLLVQKYITGVNDFTDITLDNLDYMYATIEELPAGEYNIPAIQNLYDMLIEKGVQSQQDALEVGCMVEVVDINDLLGDITLAEESNASDVATAFEFLRDGSYSHYWSFDKGLKNMGITDGCCSLGEEYCHTEYPQNESGDNGSQGKHKGKH